VRPTIGAKEFYEIYDIVTASAPSDFVVASPLPEDWMPTHYDTMMGRMVQAKRESGITLLSGKMDIQGPHQLTCLRAGDTMSYNITLTGADYGE
jgi:hypothetical protein